VAALWGLLERRERVVGAPCARSEGAVRIMYMEKPFATSFDNNTNII